MTDLPPDWKRGPNGNYVRRPRFADTIEGVLAVEAERGTMTTLTVTANTYRCRRYPACDNITADGDTLCLPCSTRVAVLRELSTEFAEGGTDLTDAARDSLTPSAADILASRADALEKEPPP